MENQQGESSTNNPGDHSNNNGVDENSSEEEENEQVSNPPSRQRLQFGTRAPRIFNILSRVRHLVSHHTFDEDDLDNERNNHPQYFIDNPNLMADEESTDDDDPEELFEQYISQANQQTDERSDFDVEIPCSHSYLGPTERVKGLTCLEINEIYQIPVTEHHSWILPGEIVPMIMLQERLLSHIKDPNDGVVFGLVFPNNMSGNKAEYGVTCQVYERGVDSRGYMTLKSKAYQRFVVIKTEDRVGPIRNQMFQNASVKILPEIVLPEPIHLAMSSNLIKFNQTKKIKDFAAASTPWPTFVYDHYSSIRATQKMERCLGMINIEPPEDAVKRSFWYARNLPLNEIDIQAVFMSNYVNERLLIISKRLEMNCYFNCNRCNNAIAMYKDIFAMMKDTVCAIYCNPAGYTHETVTLKNTLEGAVKMVDRPSAEFSWFPGYAWQIAVCASCQTHVGWRFIAIRDKYLRPRFFYGLSSKSLNMGPEITETLVNSDSDEELHRRRRRDTEEI